MRAGIAPCLRASKRTVAPLAPRAGTRTLCGRVTRDTEAAELEWATLLAADQTRASLSQVSNVRTSIHDPANAVYRVTWSEKELIGLEQDPSEPQVEVANTARDASLALEHERQLA